MTDSPTGDSPVHLVAESSGPDAAPEIRAAAPRPAGPEGGDDGSESGERGDDGNGDAEPPRPSRTRLRSPLRS